MRTRISSLTTQYVLVVASGHHIRFYYHATLTIEHPTMAGNPCTTVLLQVGTCTTTLHIMSASSYYRATLTIGRLTPW
jgi:hypothetical protein